MGVSVFFDQRKRQFDILLKKLSGGDVAFLSVGSPGRDWTSSCSEGSVRIDSSMS